MKIREGQPFSYTVMFRLSVEIWKVGALSLADEEQAGHVNLAFLSIVSFLGIWALIHRIVESFGQ